MIKLTKRGVAVARQRKSNQLWYICYLDKKSVEITRTRKV